MAPEEAGALHAFLCVLEKIEPAAARSDELTAALIAVLSASHDSSLVQRFVERSLCLEIAALPPSNDDQVRLSDSTISMLTAFLHHGCNQSIALERFLVLLRRTLLEFAQTGQDPGVDQINLSEAMARHSFTNEYIWELTSAEEADVATLVANVSERIGNGDKISAFDLFMIGAYQPLCAIEPIRNWILKLGLRDPSALDSSLRLLVFDRVQEDVTEIDAITAIDDAVSAEVRAQYEENPYPRWRHLPKLTAHRGLTSYVASNLSQHSKVSALDPRHPKVLIAGAGTGRHPIEVAKALPSSAVLAIDLSRASLAYATREAATRGIANVSFAQADILRLSGAGIEFDLIESVGVLHHMKDPEAGLRSLTRLLKPGGFLKLGLYSKVARRGINVARNIFAAGDYPPGLPGIRAFRRDLFDHQDPDLASVLNASDFFSASMFRDAVMHVKEHQHAIPEIEVMLRRNGLKFLGFSNASVLSALGKMPAKTARRRVLDLKFWDRYEGNNPDTFLGMYQFFCMKR